MAPKRAAPEAKKPSAKKTKTAAKPKAKAPLKKADAPKVTNKQEASEAPKSPPGAVSLVVEHCKQCQCFKRRTAELEGLLKESLPGLQWTVNPEKPRKGCFEVRDTEGSQKYITLLDMPRPFKRLKDLDMEEVASKIIEVNA